MTITTSVDRYGVLLVRTDVDGVLHREAIAPGRWNSGGAWVNADLSGYPQIVQDAATAAWTAQAVADYKTRFPYVAPPPPRTDQDELNDALIAPGSVVRALGLVMFAEINKLRVKAGDPAYTLAQFKTALLAQMR